MKRSIAINLLKEKRINELRESTRDEPQKNNGVCLRHSLMMHNVICPAV